MFSNNMGNKLRLWDQIEMENIMANT
jgi:hypothetical protein